MLSTLTKLKPSKWQFRLPVQGSFVLRLVKPRGNLGKEVAHKPGGCKARKTLVKKKRISKGTDGALEH